MIRWTWQEVQRVKTSRLRGTVLLDSLFYAEIGNMSKRNTNVHPYGIRVLVKDFRLELLAQVGTMKAKFRKEQKTKVDSIRTSLRIKKGSHY